MHESTHEHQLRAKIKCTQENFERESFGKTEWSYLKESK